MPQCSFKNCKNHTSRTLKKDGVSYFRFPRNLVHCGEWVSIIAHQRSEESFMPTKGSVVCSNHFLESDKYVTDKGIQRLKKTAVPQITTETNHGVDEDKSIDKRSNSQCCHEQQNLPHNVETDIKTEQKFRCACCVDAICCCKLRSLWQPQDVDGETKVYGDMLMECFELNCKKPANAKSSEEQICVHCITRLKDAYSFKADILASWHLLNMQVFENKVEIKIEYIEDADEEKFSMECSDDDSDDSDDDDEEVNPMVVTIKTDRLPTPEESEEFREDIVKRRCKRDVGETGDEEESVRGRKKRRHVDREKGEEEGIRTQEEAKTLALDRISAEERSAVDSNAGSLKNSMETTHNMLTEESEVMVVSGTPSSGIR